MAMTIALKSKTGADVVTTEIGPQSEYPEVVTHDGKTYVMKQLARDKQSATYYEAVTHDLPSQGE